MNIVFFGSDDFAAVHLEHLLKSPHKVRACVTRPDTRQGRGMKVVLSPVKILAAEHGIDVLQPQTLKDAATVARLKEFNADVFAVAAYGRLLTAEILDIPGLFCVNVHGSLLPKYRGAAPIHWAIINGDTQTGVSVQKMALALDAGDIIAREKIDIGPDMTAQALRAQMAQTGARLLAATLDRIEQGKYQLTAQDSALVSYAPKLTKDLGRIDWQKPAAVIYNLIRGLKPWPGTYTMHDGKMLKILNAAIVPGAVIVKAGTIISTDKQGFTVACGQDALMIKEVQPQAGKAMPASSFQNGLPRNSCRKFD